MFKRIHQADVINVYDWRGTPALPKRQHNNQLFMFSTLESPHSPRSSESLRSQFNLLRSYHLDSDVILGGKYFPRGESTYTKITRKVLPFEHRKAAIFVLISNCNSISGRLNMLRKLSLLFPVHSYGRCMHTHQLEGRRPEVVQEKYLFASAIENSVCKDYVTEKFYRCLLTGSVPLVLEYKSMPNYTQFAPYRNSYINMADFKTAEDLAGYLRAVSADKKLFTKHLAYRYLPKAKLSPTFLKNVIKGQENDGLCSLASRLDDPDELQKLVLQRKTPDLPCVPLSNLSDLWHP